MEWSNRIPRLRKQKFDYTGAALIGGAAALIAIPAVRALVGRWRDAAPTKPSEGTIDKELKNTYPASDPTGSHFYGIPANRL